MVFRQFLYELTDPWRLPSFSPEIGTVTLSGQTCERNMVALEQACSEALKLFT